jgi:hypothetical protein
LWQRCNLADAERSWLELAKHFETLKSTDLPHVKRIRP